MAKEDASTKTRILMAAGEIFAEVGFQAATTRDICDRAGVNLAAVNYHFRDKLGLYTEVLLYGIGATRPKIPAGPAEPEELLRQFITGVLKQLFQPERCAWHFRIMLKEVQQPTPALHTVVDEMVRPTEAGLRKIASQIAGLPMDDPRLRFGVLSIVSQFVYHFVASPVIDQIWPEMRANQDWMTALADHITRFSVAGLRSLKAEGGRQ